MRFDIRRIPGPRAQGAFKGDCLSSWDLEGTKGPSNTPAPKRDGRFKTGSVPCFN